MDTSSTRLEAVGRTQPGVKVESGDGQIPDSVQIPIDYSMTRKRRILDSYDEESPLHKAKKTLDYGSDGQSEDRSSPVHNSLTSSPEMESANQAAHRLHNLPPHLPFHNIQQQQQQNHHNNAAALHLFLQVQQHKQQQQQQQQHQHQHELMQNRLVGHQFQPSVAWAGTPSPPATPSSPALTATGIPQPMSATPSSCRSSSQEKDGAYWERRRKNNEAAKRSRDARRAKEQQVAIRAQLLEQENIRLKFEVAQLRAENKQIREHFFILHAASKE